MTPLHLNIRYIPIYRVVFSAHAVSKWFAFGVITTDFSVLIFEILYVRSFDMANVHDLHGHFAEIRYSNRACNCRVKLQGCF